MRFTFAAFCLVLAGCARSTSVAEKPVAPEKPDAVVERPVVAAVVANVPFGEDADGKAVYAASLDAARASLQDADPDVRRAAVQALDRVRWRAAEPVGGVLTLALKDADAATRLEAIRVAAAHAPHVLDAKELLQDDDRRVRIAVARTLAMLGKQTQEAYPILGAALQDRQADGRPAILELVRSKAPASQPIVPALVVLSLDAKDPLRIDAIGLLGQLGTAQESLDALLLTANDAEPKARVAALRALARLDAGSAKVQVTLVRALRDNNVDIRLAATEGAGRDGVPALMEMLRQGDERLRDAATHALGRIGPDAWAAGAELQRLAQSDPAPRVRQSATAALKAVVPQ